MKSFIYFFKSLEVCSNYMSRTTKLLKAVTLDRTDKHKEKSEQKTTIFGFCEMFIHLSFVAT
jgi:hypothetical protein